MRGQGSIEYIIILGVIIVIALIVVSSIGGFNIFSFSTTSSVRINEISNLLYDVALKYSLNSNGGLQANLKTSTIKTADNTTLTIYSNDGFENARKFISKIALILEEVK